MTWDEVTIMDESLWTELELMVLDRIWAGNVQLCVHFGDKIGR